ncbi:MAG: Flp pilus assembly complex ATPase component TadA [Coriobacteriaceae bacterium]|nr:Flp pilus assembly complex ATPase component TadA [Coriobacteriaceae bacterium]
MRLDEYLERGVRYGEEAEQSVDVRQQLQDALHEQVSSERIAQFVALGRERAERELRAILAQILKERRFSALTPERKEELVEELLDLMLGLGPLESLLEDDTVTEIMVNGPDRVFFERDGRIFASDESFSSEEELRLVIDRIISPLGRRLDEQSPIVNARLPQGHRVNAVIPPLSLVGTVLTIRKFKASAYTLEDLVGMQSMSPEVAQLLRWAVLRRINIAVSGGTGGGKTTLLNALSREIPHDERIITIEDSAELRFDTHPHVIRLEARMENAEGKGGVTIRDLVINSLRMRPDRIIVGECRGAEAIDMLQAMTTGHDGSLTTLHANSPAEVIPRLTTMVRYGMDLPIEAIERQIVSALDLIVQQDRLTGGARRITQIVTRAAGTSLAGQMHGDPFTTVVRWDREQERYIWNEAPEWVAGLPAMGLATESEVEAWEHNLH